MATIVSAQYVPASKRRDNSVNVIGDVTYVLLDCGHWFVGVPHAGFEPGDRRNCCRHGGVR